jgi:putative flippase GtrA
LFFYWNKTFFVNTERETMLEKKTISEILRFGVTGCVATLVHYLVYYVLMTFINTSVAFTIGYIVSFVLNYIMSARFTFRKKTSARNGIGFCGAHLINYFLQIVLLNIFIHLNVPERFAPLPVYCISIPVNFLIVRFVFNRSHEK